jgi:5'-3' exonuclease
MKSGPTKTKTKPREVIFVPDGNWYLHRVANTLKTSRPPEEVLPYRLLSMIAKDALAVKANYLMVPFDGPSVFRYKVYPEYKSKRHDRKGGAPVDAENAEPKVDIYSMLPHIYALFQKVGIIFFQPKTFEADDVLCSVAKVYGDRYKVVCGTQDKDAYQYLKDRTICLYDSSAKAKDGTQRPRYIFCEEAEKKKGVKTAQMVDYQTLIGDSGDSIPPIQGIGPVRAKTILNEYGTIKNWHKECREDREFITAQADNIRRNRKLVKLVEDVLPPNELQEWRIPKNPPKDPWLSRTFHEYLNFVHPKSKGLF